MLVLSVSNLILAGVGLVWLWLPGYVIGLYLSRMVVADRYARLLTSFLIALTTLPLILFLSQHFGGLPITLGSVVVVNIGLYVVALMTMQRQLAGFLRLSWLHFSPLTRHGVILMGSLIFGASFFGWQLFVANNPIAGPDSSAYLYNSALIVNTGIIPRNVDRSVFFLIPAISHMVAGVSVQTALKLLVFCLYLGSGLSVYRLSRFHFSTTISYVAMLLAFGNLGLNRLSAHIFAFLAASLVVNTIIILLTQSLVVKDKKPVLTLWLVFWLWGLIFNFHGIMAYGSMVIIGLPTAYAIYFHRKQLIGSLLRTGIIFAVAILLFWVSSTPLVYQGWQYVYRGVVMPVFKIGMDVPTPADPNLDITGVIRSNLIDKKTQPIEIPAIRSFYIEIHSLPLMALSFAGMVLMALALVYRRGYGNGQMWLLWFWGMGYFLVTQQQWLGFDWYSGRFVLAMYPVIILTSIFGVVYLGQMFAKHKYQLLEMKPGRQMVVLMLMGVLPFYLTIGYWQNQYVPTIGEEEYHTYRELPEIIYAKGAPIYYSGSNQNWIVGLNPQLNITTITNEHICNKVYARKGARLWQITEAFCELNSTESSLKTLAEESGGRAYYVVIQKQSTTADLGKFLNSNYDLIVANERVYVFRRN